MSDEIRFATIEIDGPGRNLLNPEVMAVLHAELEAAGADPQVAGIIIRGRGDVFCGGLDVPAIKAGADPVPFYRALVGILKLMPLLPKPIVAAVNGDAVASGGAIVAAADYAISAPSSLLGSYEVSVGVWPIVAQVPLVKRLGARVAMQNIASGEPFTADRALEIGLVNEVVEPGDVVASARAWLTKAARAGATAAAGRPSVYEFEQMSYDEALDVAFSRVASAYQS